MCWILIKFGMGDRSCALLIKFSFNVYWLNITFIFEDAQITLEHICQKLYLIQKNNVWNKVVIDLSQICVTFFDVMNISPASSSLLHKVKYLPQHAFISQLMCFP
jgi:hypothetical protein